MTELSLSKSSHNMEQTKLIAQAVFTSLGAGFTENIYHNAMEVLLRKFNIPFKSEHRIPVIFDDVQIGEVRADLIIDEKIVVELKSVSAINESHCTQCEMYMNLTGIREGIVINFPRSSREPIGVQEIEITPFCKKCGRDNHISSQCFAKSHVNGQRLPEPEIHKTVTINL